MDSLTIPNEILLAEAGNLLAEGRDVIILTKGSSMLPFIRGEKDSVRLRKMPEIFLWDVVLAQIAPGRYVLHRVIRIEGENLTLMGDGNIRGTEHCRKKDVLGTAVKVVLPDGTEKPMSQGAWWRALKPFRRIILGVNRRMLKLLGKN